jgi:hypothetical protein
MVSVVGTTKKYAAEPGEKFPWYGPTHAVTNPSARLGVESSLA